MPVSFLWLAPESSHATSISKCRCFLCLRCKFQIADRLNPFKRLLGASNPPSTPKSRSYRAGGLIVRCSRFLDAFKRPLDAFFMHCIEMHAHVILAGFGALASLDYSANTGPRDTWLVPFASEYDFPANALFRSLFPIMWQILERLYDTLWLRKKKKLPENHS